MSNPIFLTLDEVVERYRSQVSEGTLRNWRSMRIGPSFMKIGKAILYPLEELDRWDRRNLVVCRPSRSFSLEETTE
jgi:Helix-turn-helix domain